MKLNIWLALLLAGTAASPEIAGARDDSLSRRSGRARPASAPLPKGAKGNEPPRMDKAALEAYLKERVAKIKEAHEARLDVTEEEFQAVKGFWEELRRDREVFELRAVKHRLHVFESLASLDSGDYDAAVADFEKLQSNVGRAFEREEKEKIADFFLARQARLKQWEAEIEKERSDFASESEASWEIQKTQAKSGWPKDSDHPVRRKR